MWRVAILFLVVCAGPALSQERRPSHCLAIAGSAPGLTFLHRAGYRDPLPDHTVRISYIAHASFLIQSPGGVSAVTDYTGFIGDTRLIPDIVTMNHAHDTHWTPFPDPDIGDVLKGWGESFGQPAQHSLVRGDMLVRNVATDIRSGEGVEPGGNSIFVFEVAGLCIGHLGHLHHEPSPAQYAALGRLDVVMAAVDGGMTLDLATMMRVLKRLKSSVVIPMHWFEGWTLAAFLAGMSDEFAVVDDGAASLTLSLRSLPRRPTIHVLQPRWLREAD